MASDLGVTAVEESNRNGFDVSFMNGEVHLNYQERKQNMKERESHPNQQKKGGTVI
mgnify:CR=1 FL=1